MDEVAAELRRTNDILRWIGFVMFWILVVLGMILGAILGG